MRATSLEFRLRLPIMMAILALGYWAPWTHFQSVAALGLSSRVSSLAWLALDLSRTGLVRFTIAAPIVIVCASLIAAIGVLLRVTGAAYLGYTSVHHGQFQSPALTADGPYRFLRNPLYAGNWCTMIAISLIMPPTGTIFSIVLFSLFLVRLSLSEEHFLTASLGEPYLAYKRAVPRFIPRLRGAPPASGQKPNWKLGILTEPTPIGVFLTMAFLSWNYDDTLMARAIIVSFGASLLAGGLIVSGEPKQNPA